MGVNFKMMRVCTKCNLIHDHKSNCKKRVATRNATIEQEKLNRFYKSYKWHKLKSLKKKDELYMCEICRLIGKIGVADEVHHVIKIATPEGWEARLDYDGLVCLCYEHHKEIENLNLKSKIEIKNYYLKK